MNMNSKHLSQFFLVQLWPLIPWKKSWVEWFFEHLVWHLHNSYNITILCIYTEYQILYFFTGPGNQNIAVLINALTAQITVQILMYTYLSFDWHAIQQASTEAPVVKTVLFAFSDLSLYLSVKQPGSSKVSWHLNSFSWPASSWDWSDLNAEAFKRMPSCTAEQRKQTKVYVYI